MKHIVHNAALSLALGTMLSGWILYSHHVTAATPSVTVAVTSAATTVEVGQNFIVNIMFAGQVNEPVAGVDMFLKPSANLSLISYDQSQSVLDQEVIPPTPQNGGYRFARVRFDAGFTGSNARVLRFTFRATAVGAAKVEIIKNDSDVLAYVDSSDILLQTTPLNVTVKESTTPAVCGDNICGQDENCGTCAADCACAAGMECNAASQCIAVSSSSSAQTFSAGSAGSASSGQQASGASSAQSSVFVYHAAPGADICGEAKAIVLYQDTGSNPLAAIIGGKPVAFRDVLSNSWFAPYVSFVIHASIASGYKDESGNLTGEFGPGNRVLHGEITKMVLQAVTPDLDIATAASAPRNTLAQGQWFAPYFKMAEDRGWSLHTGQTIDGNGPATRGAVARYIVDGFQFARTGMGVIHFGDLEDDHRFASDIYTLASLGIMTGDDNKGTVRPDEPINRAEISKMLAVAVNVKCR